MESSREPKQVAAGDLIQVNEDGPECWFRCILVIDEVKSGGVTAYCTVPHPGEISGDAHIHLNWGEFDTLGVKSKFVACEMPSIMRF